MVVCLTKKDSDKQYTICSSHQLRLEVESPEWSTAFFNFAIIYNKRNKLALKLYMCT